jgi:hypothetical protein
MYIIYTNQFWIIINTGLGVNNVKDKNGNPNENVYYVIKNTNPNHEKMEKTLISVFDRGSKITNVNIYNLLYIYCSDKYHENKIKKFFEEFSVSENKKIMEEIRNNSLFEDETKYKKLLFLYKYLCCRYE